MSDFEKSMLDTDDDLFDFGESEENISTGSVEESYNSDDENEEEHYNEDTEEEYDNETEDVEVYQDDKGNFYTNDGRLVEFAEDGSLVYMDEKSNTTGKDSLSEEYIEYEGETKKCVSEDADEDYTDDEEEDADTDNEYNEDSVMDDGLEDSEEDEEREDGTLNPSINDYLDENGNLCLMNKDFQGDTFEIKLIEYKNIALAKRIRSSKNVEDLVLSIKSTGLLNPIVVAPLATEGQFVLIDGLRRVIACAKVGITQIPAIVNNKIKTTEIAMIEAVYNHKKHYTMRDVIDYTEFLEKEKGVNNPSLIEFLMELDSGDYSKLKDVISDDDEDIVTKLLDGQFTIAQAFKALEKRRAKESKEEKDIKKASKVYGDEEESGADAIANTGELGEEAGELTDEQLDDLYLNPTELDSDIDDASLDSMIQESDETPGFEAHQQKVGEREYVDPVIKKTVLARDNFTCACCKRGGESYVDALDYHHTLPVFLGGKDTPENGITLCVLCHRLVHLFSTGDLHLPKEKDEEEIEKLTEDERVIYEDEQKKFKRIVKLGDRIRKGMAQKGMNREQFKKEHPNNSIGRRKPGVKGVQEEA